MNSRMAERGMAAARREAGRGIVPLSDRIARSGMEEPSQVVDLCGIAGGA